VLELEEHLLFGGDFFAHECLFFSIELEFHLANEGGVVLGRFAQLKDPYRRIVFD
jgi:hypothetical protein